ncbi:MAG: 50S ribosomal protein L10 [Nitrososphaeria archaeon]
MSKRTRYPAKKERMYSEIVSLSKQHSYLCLSRLEKVRSVQLMMLRKMMKKEAKFIVIKNRVALKALEHAKFKGVDKIGEKFSGQILLIFTDQNPFRLSLFLSKNKISLPAKAGDMATEEIMIPAGNTGLAPGPVLSEFKEANVPTKIDGGSIWIVKDTIVAKKGDVFSPKLAGLLNRLNIKPIKAGLTIAYALMDDIALTEEDLTLDLERFTKDLQTCYWEARNLAINSDYYTAEVMKEILAKAYLEAQNLALNSDYMSEDNIRQLLQKYEIKAKTLYEILKERGYS